MPPSLISATTYAEQGLTPLMIGGVQETKPMTSGGITKIFGVGTTKPLCMGTLPDTSSTSISFIWIVATLLYWLCPLVSLGILSLVFRGNWKARLHPL